MNITLEQIRNIKRRLKKPKKKSWLILAHEQWKANPEYANRGIGFLDFLVYYY